MLVELPGFITHIHFLLMPTEMNNTEEDKPDRFLAARSSSSDTPTEGNTPDATPSHSPPKKRRRKTSTVWAFFSEPFSVPGRGTVVRCNLCDWEMKYSSSTSGLRNHLTNKHHKVLDQSPPSGEMTPELSLSRSPSPLAFPVVSERNMALWLCSDLVPPKMFDNPFLRQGAAIFKLPESTGLENKILPQLAQEVRAIRQQLLSSSIRRVHLSTEMWRDFHGQRYCAVSAHFLDLEMGVHHVTLEVVSAPLHEELSAEVQIQNCLTKFRMNLPHDFPLPISTMTGNHLPALVQLEGVPVVSLPCVGQAIQSALSAFLCTPQISEYVFHVRAVVSQLQHSPSIYQALYSGNTPESAPPLKFDEGERWFSTFCMLENFLNQYRHIRHVFGEHGFGHWPLFAGESLHAIDQIVSMLRPFGKLALHLKTNRFASLALAVPLLYSASQGPTSPEALFWETFCGTAKPVLDFHLNVLLQNDMVLASIMLDPRFANFQWLNSNPELKEHCYGLARKWITDRVNPVPAPRVPANAEGGQYYDMFSGDNGPSPQAVQAGNYYQMPECDVYLAEITSLGEQNANALESPLLWWRTKRTHYPAMYQLAREVLAIPAMSSESDYFFSAKGPMVDRQRHLLPFPLAAEMYLIRQNLSLLCPEPSGPR